MREIFPGDKVRIVTEKFYYPQAILGEEYIVKGVGDSLLWIKVPSKDNYVIQKSQVVKL